MTPPTAPSAAGPSGAHSATRMVAAHLFRVGLNDFASSASQDLTEPRTGPRRFGTRDQQRKQPLEKGKDRKIMRLKTLAASIAFALFSTVASAQTVTVHSGGLGDFTNLYDARDAVLADPASPDVIEILDEGPFIGPNITFNDTPVLTEGVWV